MDDQTLKSLLQQADATTSAPSRTVSDDDLLAAADWRRRRASYAKAAAASLVLFAVALGALRHMRPTPHRPNEPVGNGGTDIAKAEPLNDVHKTSHHEDLASLDHEAQMREQVVRAVLAEQQSDTAAVEPQTDDADLVRLEAARSAALCWQYASFVETDMNDPEAAHLDCRHVPKFADRFPGTTWAALATSSVQRLQSLNSPPSL
jgi:hypothetical protein